MPIDLLSHAVRDQLTERHVPAMSIATIGDGRITSIETVGKRSNRAAPLVNAQTQFQAASLSKTINAIAVLALVRDGQMAIDKPVNQYLKRWKLTGPYADHVTSEALLTHTGGTNVHGFAGYVNGAAIPTLLDVLSGIGAANNPPISIVTKPTSGYCYSGGGVTVLQALVEDVTDTPYEDVVLQTVLKPLGMDHSFMGPPVNQSNLAMGHGSKGGQIRGGYRIHPEMAAAGLWSTPSDIARALIAIGQCVRGQSQALLPQHLARTMITPVVHEAALGTYCDHQGRISHNGSNRGYRSGYVFDVQAGYGIVVMANGENAHPINLALVHQMFD